MFVDRLNGIEKFCAVGLRVRPVRKDLGCGRRI